MKLVTDNLYREQPSSGFIRQGGELRLSNLGQLELLRGMAERGVPLRTTVRGFSMHPFIRDEDVLTIAPMNGNAPSVGDVIAFTQTATGRLAIHRIVARSTSGWLVRGDNCPESDGIVPRENMIGHVIRVERQGKEVRLGLGPERSWIGRLNRGNGLAFLRRLSQLPRRAVGFALRSVQTLRPYRTIGRHLAPRLSVLQADETDMVTVHRRLNSLAPHQIRPKNPNVTDWIACLRGKTMGFVQYVYHPESHDPWVGHWLFSLQVFALYRGLGVGEILTRRVMDQAAEKGASELFLAVYEDNERAIRLYQKLGFQQAILSSLEPAFAAEKEQLGRRRIVMRRSLKATP